MCGIAGLIGVPGDNRGRGQRLLDALRHRGPDDEGVEHPTPVVTLVHTRLSILDLSATGHQPMADNPPVGLGRNWVVFNGEIFNYKELQNELAEAGWPCRTRSDTEVILNGYRVWGADCVKRFRGMFAFCIVDQDAGLALFSRDRMGIKPLYLYRPKRGGVIFSSEVRAILSLGPDIISPRINPVALESYFAQGAVQGDDTLVHDVCMLEPGTNLKVDLNSGRELSKRTFWCVPNGPVRKQSRASSVEYLNHLAREAVKLRLISDVPIGLFLSGGVDSAALLAIASETTPESLRTISVGFDVSGFDESDEAAATAASFGARHTSLKITGKDVLDAMPSVLKAMDQPTVDGTNTFIVSRAARRAGLTVALSGLGGDELFGGYASFTDVPRAVAWRRKLGRRGALLSKLVGLIRRGRSGAKMAEALTRTPGWLSMYLLRRELFLPHERRQLQRLPAWSDETTGLSQALMEHVQSRGASLDNLNRVSFFEVELYMRHMLLRDADVFSMAAPIEYRVPFLDHQLVEAVFSLPGEWKRPDPRPKPLLIDLVGARLPEAVWRRPKRGFTFPWGAWFAPGGALAEAAREAASDSLTWQQIGINPTGVLGIWRSFTSGDKRVSPLQLLAFITLRHFAVSYKLRAA